MFLYIVKFKIKIINLVEKFIFIIIKTLNIEIKKNIK